MAVAPFLEGLPSEVPLYKQLYWLDCNWSAYFAFYKKHFGSLTIATIVVDTASYTFLLFSCLLCLQLTFEITSEEMMLYDTKDTKWYVPTTEYKVFVGGQQPNQQTSAPSNILDGSFTVQHSV